LVNDWAAVAPGDVWHVAFDGPRRRFELGAPGTARVTLAATTDGLLLANSHHWYAKVARESRFVAAIDAPAPGRLRIATPLRPLRTRLTGNDASGRWLQVGLDALGSGTATFDVEVDAIDRFVALTPR
jgi:hypothetical protein